MIKSRFLRFMGVVAVGTCTVWCPSSRAADAAAGFKLQDFLNRDWSNECVEFPLSPAQLADANAGKALAGPDGKPVLYQLVKKAGNETPEIAFLAGLASFETRVYTFNDSKVKAVTDLKIEDVGDDLRLSNGFTGISIPKKLTGTQGPLDAIRLKSGKWVGSSQLIGNDKPVSWTAEVTARGPVFAEVVCKADFGAGRTWELKFHLQANEPVVLVDETYSLSRESRWVLNLSRDFVPDSLFYQATLKKGEIAVDTISSLAQQPYLFNWMPWVVWSELRSAKWFGLFNTQGPDFLALGARDSQVWVDPAKNSLEAVSPKVTLQGQDVIVTLPLADGQRRWMIGSFDKNEVLKGKDSPPTLPHQYVIKYEFPLNLIKSYVLQWPGADTHPHMLATPADVKRMQATYVPPQDPLHPPGGFDALMIEYMLTHDPTIGHNMAGVLMKSMQSLVDMPFLHQDLGSLGSWVQSQYLLQNVPAQVDALLSGDAFTPEQKEILRAQAAFVSYSLARPDYWFPERGFHANPNMTTMVSMYRISAACLFPSHPMAKEWIEGPLKELKRQVDEWSDDNGGWLEAPHYAMVSYDNILGGLIMARNTGYGDYVHDPKLKKVAEYFANVSTPPDSRIMGLRHLQPIGNTYLSETSGEFGVIAGIWKEKDPGFASEMQWMYHQQGSDPHAISSALGAYRDLIADTTIPEKAPHYGSVLYPETGVALRGNTFPSDRETMLWLIAGAHREHYNFDSGAITLWGKGRIIADGFGYEQRNPVNESSVPETPVAGPVLAIKDFSTTEPFDYVRGVANGWTRQIVFVKDSDPLAPNYFLLSDTFTEANPISPVWRLWLACRSVTPGALQARVEGNEDVDTDIQFLSPGNVELKTEDLTLQSYGRNTTGALVYGIKMKQTGLIATGHDVRVFNVVIYPRLKTQKPPVVTSIADGKGAKIVTEAGTDYVFVSNDPVQYKDADISFNGTAGGVELRGPRKVLWLGAAGTISEKDQTLKADKAATRQL